MQSCTRCALHKTARTVCVPPRGAEKPLILFVGIAPGKQEDQQGTPFVGPAGQKLRDLMERAGIKEEWCRYTNVARCVPWDGQVGFKVRDPDESEMDACSIYLDAEIRARKPMFVVPLGLTPAKYFLGDGSKKEFKLGKFRGRRSVVEIPTVRFRYVKMLEFVSAHGIVDKDLLNKVTRTSREEAVETAVRRYGFHDFARETTTVFPSYHPASIIYGNPRAEEDILADLNYLAQVITGGRSNHDYQILLTLEDVQRRLEDLKRRHFAGEFPWVSCDIEATSLNMFDSSWYMTTVGFCGKPGEAFAIPWDHHESPFRDDPLAKAAIRQMLNDFFKVVPVNMHNGKFDYKCLRVCGIHVMKIAEDTELSAWDLTNDTSEHGLEYLVSKFTDLKVHKHEIQEFQALIDDKNDKYNTDMIPLDIVGKYNCGDCDGSQRISFRFTQMLHEQGLYVPHQTFAVKQIIPVAEMEINGCALDRSFMEVLNAQLLADIQAIDKQLADGGYTALITEFKSEGKEFKVGSSEDVATLLFTVLGMKPLAYGKERKNGRLKGERVPSTDKTVLAQLVEQCLDKLDEMKDVDDFNEEKMLWKERLRVIKLIQEHKKASKLYSAYGKSLLKKLGSDGLLHPTYGIRHTATGRYNCENPSFQVIPWHSVIKKAFISRFVDGIILSADESQMELRVFAMVTGDPDLIAAFKADKDIHRLLASKILKVPEVDVPTAARRRIKTVVFGLLYGRGARAIAQQEGISVDEAKQFIADVFKTFPRIQEFISQSHAFAEQYRYVNYINGYRRLLVPDQDDDGSMKRQAVNSPIQGTASDLAAYAVAEMYNYTTKLGKHSKIYQFVHDSIGYDVAPGELFDISLLLHKAMVERPAAVFPWVTVPLKVEYEVGVSWGHFIDMKILDGRKLEFQGSREYTNLLFQRMMRWQDTPTILQWDDFIKKDENDVPSEMTKVIADFPLQVKRGIPAQIPLSEPTQSAA